MVFYVNDTYSIEEREETGRDGNSVTLDGSQVVHASRVFERYDEAYGNAHAMIDARNMTLMREMRQLAGYRMTMENQHREQQGLPTEDPDAPIAGAEEPQQ